MRQPGFTPPEYASASQMKKIDVEKEPETSCFRRFGFQYVMGFPDPAGKAAELGSEVHKLLENFLLTGQVFPPGRAGRLAHTAMPYVKEAVGRPGLEVEGRSDASQEATAFLYVEDGITYKGYVDVAWMHPGGFPVVRDWKTSSNPKAHGLTLATMLKDPQAVLYARQALARHDAPRVMLDWIYMTTRGPKQPAFAVRAQYTKKQIDEAWPRVHTLGRKVAQLKVETKHANELEPNWKACNAYGKPCPFMESCDGALDPKKVIGAIAASSDGFIREEDLLARLPGQQATKQKEKKTVDVDALLKRKKARLGSEAPAAPPRATPPAQAQAQAQAQAPAQAPAPATATATAEPGPVPVRDINHDKIAASRGEKAIELEDIPRTGLDPAKARAAYDAQERTEAMTDEQRAQRVNAPESGSDEQALQTEMSAYVERVSSNNKGKGKAKKARETYAQIFAARVSAGDTLADAHIAACEAANIDPETCKRLPDPAKSTTKSKAKADDGVHPSEALLRCLHAAAIYCAEGSASPESLDDLERATEHLFRLWQAKFGA